MADVERLAAGEPDHHVIKLPSPESAAIYAHTPELRRPRRSSSQVLILVASTPASEHGLRVVKKPIGPDPWGSNGTAGELHDERVPRVED